MKYSGEPHGYFFDLREKATVAGPTPADGAALVRRLTENPERVYPVDVIQVGLGALQLGEAWLPVMTTVVDWIERAVDGDGLLAIRFPMPHTFALPAPWYSSLPQGEAASLLVRAAALLDRLELLELAQLVAAPLLRADSELVATTPQGPVLQEYPTSPPSHVLNGWITSLWGLYDVARSGYAPAGAAFDGGVAAVAARLHCYDTPIGWSRYDLFPHLLTNIASPFYHRLHVGHLRALNSIAPHSVFVETADRWESTLTSPFHRSFAVTRKVLFRIVRPRWRRVY